MANIKPVKLGDALLAFNEWQISQRLSENTLKGYRSNMARFLDTVGAETYVHQITPQDVTKYMAYYATKGQGTQNNAIQRIKGFFAYARLMKHMSRFEEDSPAQGWKSRKYEIDRPEYIGAAQWPALLETARNIHPMYAAYAATGLYIMGRGPSELSVLKIKHLNITGDAWRLGVKRVKSKQATDWMMVPGELRLELTSWLLWYNEWTVKNLGKELQPEWLLFPTTWFHSKGPEFWPIQPTVARSSQSLRNMVERILRDFGYETQVQLEDGSWRRNGWCGTHAFRRFGARALFDELLTRDGYDGALAVVREMLGHARNDITETYLNLKLDRTLRDRAAVANEGFMFAHNAPGAVEHLSGKQLPQSMAAGVTLGRPDSDTLDDATAKILDLAAFRAA